MARDRTPLVAQIGVETGWWRIHRAARAPMHFGPTRGSPPLNRFDAPEHQYRVAYFGTTREAAFAEVFLHHVPVDIITMDELATRHITRIRLTRPLQIVELHGRGLARAGMTGAATTGSSYAESRQMALSLWERSENYDGLRYHARHDDGELSVALFDRAAEAVAVAQTRPLTTDTPWLASLAERYGVEFVP